uniref:Cytochrome P450 n=1 Tax=Oryza punctata TaxID=4537 RepID=A0A0E0JK66_ORYPU
MEKSELWLLWAVLSASLIFFYLTILRRSAAAAGGKGGKPPLPPGPTPLPLIGNLLSLRGGVIHDKLAALARVYGPVMMIKLGLNDAVIISSRDAAREAFTRYDRHLAARAIPDTFRANGFHERSAVFLPSSDERWKALRGIQGTHIFTPRGLATVRPVRERKVRDIIGYFRDHAGEELVIRQAIHTGVLNLVSSSFFSMDIADMGSETARELREHVDEIMTVFAQPNVSDYFPFLRRLDLQGLRRSTKRRFDRIFSILDDIIERRLVDRSARGASSNNKSKQHHDGDFLDALLELMVAGKMERDDVSAMLFEGFVAGGDTVAFTLEWVMADLLRNPPVMAKLRAELDDVLGGKDEASIEEHDAARLPYLQAVLKESMRLHSVGPLLHHFAAEDGVVVGGYAVPRGATVLFNTRAIMRDPAAWERPEEFAPERFLLRETPLDFRGKEADFLPFGSGRRVCPGIPLAERVMPFILALMLHTFEWRLPDGMSPEELDVSEKFMSVNVLAVPLKAVPVKVIN